MDVIALTEAGFAETVAPLGTALTEEQVKLLWRLARRAGAVLRRRCGRPQGGLPRRRNRAAALEARASACASRSSPAASIPTISCASRVPTPSRPSLPSTRALFDVLWAARGAGAGSVHARAARRLRDASQGDGRARSGMRRCKAHYERELRETLWTLNRTVVREIARGEGQRRDGPYRRAPQQCYARLARTRARPADPGGQQPSAQAAPAGHGEHGAQPAGRVRARRARP